MDAFGSVALVLGLLWMWFALPYGLGMIWYALSTPRRLSGLALAVVPLPAIAALSQIPAHPVVWTPLAVVGLTITAAIVTTEIRARMSST